MSQKVLIVGAGSGLSASLARRCHAAGMQVVLAARDGEKARAVAQETGASLHRFDAASIKDVAALFAALDAASSL